ncbi:protease [Salmonella enterica]|uniref:Protease n=2 Tax=Salmonella enterica TaxID=28901 RepID=A0A7U6BLG9_SALER|nr:protease [Salmonella enterica]EBW3154488.1 protease [Salmonella enterica subsp. enterica serovar Java]ECJ4484491.1 protease [Salmonella enterica subsp. diarizonae]EGE4753622.1 protease [Salmonella enterica subsp. diarizonae serovar 38:[k]:z35]EAM3008505.1 protease [Salmonella enterica]
MVDIYVGLLAAGVLLALFSLIAGDWLESIFCLDALHPMVVASGCTVAGGAGILLLKHTALTTVVVLFLALACALILSVAVFYGYVRPMRHAETSTAFSMKELTGKEAVVSVTIPAQGYGEVMIRVGAGSTSQVAASFDGTQIEKETIVVVVEVTGGVVFVSPFSLE